MSVPPRRHCDDGRALFRYADRVAVRCHRCDTPGWVTGPFNARRFRCLGCSEALDGGCGCNRRGAGDWVGPVRYSGYRPCGYCGHQWLRIEVRRARATLPLRTMAADCSQCGRSSDVDVTPSRWHGNDAIDPNFGLPLRLVEKTAAGLLWAYNAEHLQALHDYATATLREGSGHHRSMFSCLPQWMKLARNRVLLQRAVERLQRRLLRG